MHKRMRKAGGFPGAMLALLLAAPAAGLGDESPDGTSGHEHGTGKNRLIACSSALDEADAVAARIGDEAGLPVEVRPCECEEDPRAPENERFRCLVHWAIRIAGD